MKGRCPVYQRCVEAARGTLLVVRAVPCMTCDADDNNGGVRLATRTPSTSNVTSFRVRQSFRFVWHSCWYCGQPESKPGPTRRLPAGDVGHVSGVQPLTGKIVRSLFMFQVNFGASLFVSDFSCRENLKHQPEPTKDFL